jgi:hypothetical protein
MTTYVIEISERVEVASPKDLVTRLEQELGRPLMKAEALFIGSGARLVRDDQRTGRTVTAYRKAAVPPARPKDFTEKSTATSKGGRS